MASVSRADVSDLQYFFGANATQGNVTVGGDVQTLGMYSWSITAVSVGGAKGTLSYQFTDFSGIDNVVLPFDWRSTYIEGSNSSVTGTGVFRFSKSYDPINNASRYLRIVFTPSAGSTGTMYLALTMKAQAAI